MTDSTPTATSATNRTMSLDERILFALRQAGLLAVALLVAGLVTNRLRPLDATNRDIAATPFLWAIIVWAVVLLVNALAFEQSQMKVLERWPLFGALGVGALLFVIGLVSYDAGALGHRVTYLVANSLGAVMFWWAILGLVALAVERLTQPDGS